MSNLKKVLLATVELRIVTVLLSLATLVFGALMFGAFMKDGAERSAPRGGALSRPMEQRFPGRSGLEFAFPRPRSTPSGGGQQERTDGKAGYLVVARHVPDADVVVEPADSRVVGNSVEIIDLNRRKTVHTWKPVPGDRLRRFFVLPGGSLLAGVAGRVFRIDACSNVLWDKRLGTHHSFERDADGHFWSPWRVVPHTVPHANPEFEEHGLIRFSPAGEVLSQISLWPALVRAGHSHLLYGDQARLHGNPWHINDVEPVLQDGPFWRRGDLFVSFRNSSVVFLYRPATDEVLWLQAGPWLHQHDVDVLSDSEISVFSNNTFRDRDDNPRVLGANEVYVYDFETGETRSPWREAMRRHDVRTEFEGGAAVFGDGGVVLEEARYGRILMLSPAGERVWSYVNRASDGTVHRISASRYLDAEYGAEVMRSIVSRDCRAAVN